jgi:hypothetical protein
MFNSNILAVSFTVDLLGASFADVRWVISAYVLAPHQRESETAPMRAEAPAKMPCKLFNCRDPGLTSQTGALSKSERKAR